MVEEKEGGGSGGVMASDATDAFDAANAEHPYLKIIILGDSAVGKSK